MKFLKIKQERSVNGAMERHRRTVRALGLHRIGETVYQNDSAQLRGMIESVRYMVTWELVDSKPKEEKKTKKAGYKVVKSK